MKPNQMISIIINSDAYQTVFLFLRLVLICNNCGWNSTYMTNSNHVFQVCLDFNLKYFHLIKRYVPE